MSGRRIAFIGLGVMGAPMARRLIGAGYRVSLCDAAAAGRAPFEAEGIAAHAVPEAAAEGAEVVITMLPGSAAVRAVLLGEAGALRSAAPGALCIEMSTGSLPALMALGRDVEAAGARLMDAPVGRSRREAETGQLLAMVGGAEADVAEARPLLAAMASDIVHAGGLGKGLSLKLVNNYMAMVNHVLTAEVLAMAQRAGLDLDLTVAALGTTSAGRGQLLTNFPKKVLAGDISADFPITMGVKDLTMAMEMCGGMDAPGRFGEVALGVFREAAEQGFGGYDCTGVLHFLEGRTAEAG